MANRSLAKPKKTKRRGVQVWHRTPIREMGPSIVPLPPLTVTPHDNEIMGAPQVVAIYWGTPFNTGGTGKTGLAINLDNFFQRLLPSRYMSLLSEYGVGPATFVGSVCLPHDPGTPETLDEAALETKLRAWLDGSLLPRIPGPNETSLLFAIFIPPEITVTGEDADGGCAYHKAVKYQKGLGKNNLFYTALKWAGTGSSAQDLAALTGTASHELVEAFTNRSFEQGWYDDSIGYEIGDACSSCGGPGIFDRACPYPLSSYWLQSLRRCLREADVNLAMDINRNQDGRIELFASAPGYGLWHAWQNRPGVDQWSSGSLGAPPGVQEFSSGPAVFSNDDGRLEVFILGIDGRLWHIYQTIANNGWSSWGPLGSPAAGIQSAPAVFKNQDGRLEVFVIGTDGALWHNWQEQKNQQSNAWSGWFSLGVPSGPVPFSLLADPAVSINIDGGLAVFAVGGDGQVWYIFQSTADKTVWSNWRSLAPPPPQPYFFEEAPEVTRNVAGEIQFFLVDRAGPLRSLLQSAPGDVWSPTWLNITLPAQVLLGPAVAQNSLGFLEVFFVGDDGALWNIEQISQSGGSQSWSGWNALGNPSPLSLAAVPVAFLGRTGTIEGALEVFALDSAGVLQHIWQSAPGGPWSNWEQLAQQFPQVLGRMSLGVKAVKKSASTVTISVTVRDSSTSTPIAGATVTIFDDTGARATASGTTADDGTVILKYLKCVDPETKTPDACPGVARKAGYQNYDFLTPYPV